MDEALCEKSEQIDFEEIFAEKGRSSWKKITNMFMISNLNTVQIMQLSIVRVLQSGGCRQQRKPSAYDPSFNKVQFAQLLKLHTAMYAPAKLYTL